MLLLVSVRNVVVLTLAVWGIHLRVVCGLPAIVEGEIDLKTLTVKGKRPSESFLFDLEATYGRPLAEVFESSIEKAERMPAESLLAVKPSTAIKKAILVAPALQKDQYYYLVAPMALESSSLDQLLQEGGRTFLEVNLPPKVVPSTPSQDSERLDDSSSQVEIGQNQSNATVSIRSDRTSNPITSAAYDSNRAVSDFFSRFIQLDPSEENAYIPETVRKALKTSQQLLVKPPAFLHVPEGVTEDAAQYFTVTTRRPVDILFGLFTRRDVWSDPDRPSFNATVQVA